MSGKETISGIVRKIQLNLSRVSIFSLIVFVLIHVLIILEARGLHQYYSDHGQVENIHLIALLFSGLLLYAGIIVFQEIYNAEPDRNIIEQLKKNNKENKNVSFRCRSGFKKPQLYIWMFIGYSSFLAMTIFYFVIPVFNVTGSNPIILKLMGWLPFAFVGFFVFYQYGVIASYMEIHKDVFVVRKGLVTYYFNAGSINLVIYLMRYGQLNTIMFEFENGRSLFFKLNYLTRFARSIRTEIDSLYDGDARVSVLKRIPKQEKISSVSRQLRGGFGRVTRW